MVVPIISVLMTCYNAELTIIESIQSIIDQSYESWELIIIDDGSTDGTINLISELADNRIKIVPLPKNFGRTYALNLGLKIARGQYIAILDSDDVSESTRLARQVDLLASRNDLVGVGTFFTTIDMIGNEIARYGFDTSETAIKRQMAHNLLLVHSSMMYRRNSCLMAGGYTDKYVYAVDFALWLELIQIGDIGAIPEYLTHIRINPNSMTRNETLEKHVILDALRLYIAAQKVSDLHVTDRLRGLRTIIFLFFKFCVFCSKRLKKNITNGTK
jgi:glycosyltransferase involved in cell wall biosynthesis